MSNKISLTNLVNLTNQTTAVNAINANNAALTTAINNTLSRDGTPPNQMGSAFDMNNNRILNLPTAISTSEPVTLNQMAAALAAAGTINTGLTGVPVSAAMQPVVNATTIASAQTQLQVPTPYVDAALYGVVADGTTDCTTALQAAVTAAAGREVRLPPGTIVISSQIRYVVPNINIISIYAPGLKIRGSGVERTIIDNRVANNSCFFDGGNVSGTFSYGGYIKDLAIKTTTNPPGSHGIEHYISAQYVVENVHVFGLSGDGMRVTANLGDADASNIMTYRNCRFENCSNGLNCNYATNVVQPSFMRVEDSVFSGNTIGWRFIGLNAMAINNGFVINGTGLAVVNNGGSNAQFTSLGNSFENNGTSINIGSLQGGTFVQTELACASAFAPGGSTQAVVMSGCESVEFTGTRVRISSSPYALWTFGSGAVLNSIKNTFYQNYDNSGQSRYSITAGLYGNRYDDAFDSVQMGYHNGVEGIQCVTGSNENLPVPLDGAVFSIGGPTNNFSIGGLTNGFDGRRLTLINLTGFTMTMNVLDSSSTTTNQIRGGAGNVAIGNQGSCTLLYSAGTGAWFIVGQG